MDIVTRLAEIATERVPSWSFLYDTPAMANERSDDGQYPLIWMEEYFDVTAEVDAYGREMETADVELHFLMLSEYHDDGAMRRKIYEAIKADAVRPFMEGVREDGLLAGAWTCSPEPPLFDANAVGLFVRFRVSYPACLFDNNED